MDIYCRIFKSRLHLKYFLKLRDKYDLFPFIKSQLKKNCLPQFIIPEIPEKRSKSYTNTSLSVRASPDHKNKLLYKEKY